MSKRRLKPEEHRAWARVARSVKPLAKPADPQTQIMPPLCPPHAPRTDMNGPKPPPQWTSMPRPDTAIYPARLSPPIDRSGEKRVRRGQTAIAARLDLHGHTQISARAALVGFIHHQRRGGARCVLVITGKGRAGEGTLRRRFLDWLGESDLRVHISGYAEANRKHGGAGAWYVFLRRL